MEEEAERDFFMSATSISGGMPGFRGVLGHRLAWNTGSNQWEVTSFLEDHKNVRMVVKTEDIMTGYHLWTPVSNSTSTTSPMMLKMTGCGQDHFSCFKYGECLPVDMRCDGKVDCPDNDQSDEEHCDLIVMDEFHYQKRQVPSDNLVVHMDVHIEDIQRIHELDSAYTLQVKLSMMWYDQRLEYRNLRLRAESNMVSEEDREKLWIPSLVFNNTDDNLRTILDQDTLFMILREGEHTFNPLSETSEDLVYSATENRLMLSRLYTIELKCFFELTMFPFDHQKCPLVLQVPSHLAMYVTLELDNITSVKTVEANYYAYGGFEVVSARKGDFLEIQMSLDRRWKFYIASTFLPSSCLMAVAILTLFVDESHFEATIMVALTAMLVMQTLYQSVSGTLPSTAYLKMIDLWLLAGMLLPFVVFMVLLLVDAVPDDLGQSNAVQPMTVTRIHVDSSVPRSALYTPPTPLKKDQNSVKKRILYAARIVVPSLTLVFFGLFFYSAISQNPIFHPET